MEERKRLATTLFDDVDYLSQLTKEDQKWLYHFLAGTSYASEKQLAKLDRPITSELISELSGDRDAYRRDTMNRTNRQELASEENLNFENSHMAYQEGIYMPTFEDALIHLIDRENEARELMPKLTPYGNGTVVPVGSDVVVCIEGHHYQGKVGTVIGTRKHEYLIRMDGRTLPQTTMYVTSDQISRVNQMKQVG